MPDSNLSLSEAIEQARQAIGAMRESLVQLVMRRNRAQEEANRVERTLKDLEVKAALAEQINNPRLAAELRAQIAQRARDLETLRVQLAALEKETETAKQRLPEEEARLAQRINDLKAGYVQSVSAQFETGLPGGTANAADSAWERASAKISDLRNEADARNEVAGTRAVQIGSGATSQTSSGNAGQTPDVEGMLADLESRLGQQKLANTKGRAGFLEFDDAPVTEAAVVQPVQASPAITDASSDNSPSAPAVERKVTDEITPTHNPQERVTATPAFSIVTRPLLTQGKTAPMETTARVRVAAIGTGGIFRGAHLPCYPDIPQAQLVALCDPDKNAQDLAYKRYQSLMEAKIKAATEKNDIAAVERMENDLETVQICDDISEVIESIKPDLVDICTLPFLHTPLAIQALEAGIHVMCEKPISRSWLESQRLIETIARTGKFYQHNENWLFDPDYYTVKKLVDAGAIGELAMMFLTQAHGGPEGNPRFWSAEFGGGGALLDNGIHAIGAAWFVAGLHKSPTLVKAAEPFGMSIRMPQRIINSRYQQVDVDDDAHILIRFEAADGAWTTAHVEGSWSEQDSPDTVYIGTTGRIAMKTEEDGKRYAVITDAHGSSLRKFRVSGPTWQHWPSSFYGEILNMVECVRNNEQSIMTAQFGADCSAIVGASYLSEKNGRRPVHLNEFKEFANSIAAKYPGDPKAADDALVDELLSAVRKG